MGKKNPIAGLTTRGENCVNCSFCMLVSSFLHWLITASYFMLYFPVFGRKNTGHCELRTVFKIFMPLSFFHTTAMRKLNTLFNYRKDYHKFQVTYAYTKIPKVWKKRKPFFPMFIDLSAGSFA